MIIMKTIKKPHMNFFYLCTLVVFIAMTLLLTITKSFSLSIFYNASFQKTFYFFVIFLFSYILFIQFLQNLNKDRKSLFIILFCIGITSIVGLVLLRLWFVNLYLLIPIVLLCVAVAYCGIKIYLNDKKAIQEISLKVEKEKLQAISGVKEFSSYIMWFAISAIVTVFLLIIPSQINMNFLAIVVFFGCEIIILIVNIFKNCALRKLTSSGFRGVIICAVSIIVAALVFVILTVLGNSQLNIFRSLICIAIISAANSFNDCNSYYLVVKTLIKQN